VTFVTRRDKLSAELIRAGRSLGNSSAMLTHACSESLGVHDTDWECVSLLYEALPGTLTAGQVANLTGLSTGAVTGVLDRLEAGGWVRRDRDPVDRRRVIVRLIDERMAQSQPLFAGMLADMIALHDDFTDDELASAVKMLDRASAILRRHALDIRRGARSPLSPGAGSSPDDAAADE
jgi:DNA-binding MarR family transcriptional regulator